MASIAARRSVSFTGWVHLCDVGASPPVSLIRRRPRSTSRVRPRLGPRRNPPQRSEEHTSELQSLMRISYAVFCLKKKNKQKNYIKQRTTPLHKSPNQAQQIIEQQVA